MSEQAGQRWQFSLLTLLIAMGGVAVVSLALRSPNEIWSTAVFLAVLAGLALAALAAIYRDGRTRAFALGFLVVGAGYWGLVLLAERPEAYGQPRLPTTRWAIALFSLLHEDSVQSATVMTAVYTASTPYTGPPPPLAPATPSTLPSVPPTSSFQPVPVTTYVAPAVSYTSQIILQRQFSMQTFLDISQQALVLLLGVLGGVVAQWLYATRREEPSPKAAASG